MASFTFSSGLTIRSKRGSDSRAAWAIRHNGLTIASGTALTRADAVMRAASKNRPRLRPDPAGAAVQPAKASHAPVIKAREAVAAGWREGGKESAHAFLLRRWREAVAARRAVLEVEIVGPDQGGLDPWAGVPADEGFDSPQGAN